MMTLMAGGLGPGISSAVARALGADRAAEASAVAEHALLLTFALGVLLTVGLELSAPALFALLGGEEEVIRQATLFAQILFAGLLFTFAAATFDSIMRGEGNVRVPAVYGALSLGLQIVLAPVLMFVVGLGLAGAPLAMVLGQFVGTIPRAYHVLGGRGVVRPRFFPRVFRWNHVSEILRVGVPSSLTGLVNYTGIAVVTAIMARFGTAHLAAFGLGTRLGLVLFTLGYGVAAAALTLVGMAFGAERPRLVTRYAWQTTAVALGAVLVPVAVVVLWPQVWFGLFTGDAAIHAVGRDYLHVVGPSYLFAVAAMVLGSCFQAVRRAGPPLILASIRVAVVIAAAIAVARWLADGAVAVFLVIACGNVFAALSLAVWFRSRVGLLKKPSANE
jgi:putative MATE family efflux protein